MKNIWLVALIFTGMADSSFGLIELGQSVPNLCWHNAEDRAFCIDDYKTKVRVLLYSTGWCPNCNEEMEKLVPMVAQFKEKDVVFLSLSAEGWKVGALPSQSFLKEWRQKFRIPFPVLASPRDPGRNFFEPPITIPNFAIVNKRGKLAAKEAEFDLGLLLREVTNALEKD